MIVGFIGYLIFTIFFLVDIYLDIKESVPLAHIWHEVLLLVTAIIAGVWQLVIIVKKNRRIDSINSELLETKNSYKIWREKSHTNSKAIRDLIDEQFSSWHLTESEKDVALLLIKGFSMKEIAEFRNSHEKTVRQHSSVIYKKAGLSGRQELAAFFLEDIFSTP